jgi:hypothetical protein
MAPSSSSSCSRSSSHECSRNSPPCLRWQQLLGRAELLLAIAMLIAAVVVEPLLSCQQKLLFMLSALPGRADNW